MWVVTRKKIHLFCTCVFLSIGFLAGLKLLKPASIARQRAVLESILKLRCSTIVFEDMKGLLRIVWTILLSVRSVVFLGAPPECTVLTVFSALYFLTSREIIDLFILYFLAKVLFSLKYSWIIFGLKLSSYLLRAIVLQ